MCRGCVFPGFSEGGIEMSQISISNLTFCYEGSSDNIFEEASFSFDTRWRLGLIGRNGKGKTTLLKILQGKYDYRGKVTASVGFDYFPYPVPEQRLEQCAADFLDTLKPGCEIWRVICELKGLHADEKLLERPFGSLSLGERTKVLLAVLFSGDHEFLLIDEPTNHLDQEAREMVKQYLCGKKGFLLVSHDRDLLDGCVDHVLVLNRKTIEVQNGNFSSWWENKTRRDHFVQSENEKHMREISALKKAADRTNRWAEKNENSKIGFDPRKEPDRSIAARAYIGAKTKKMQSRVTQFEQRMEREIQEKEGLLQDVENPVTLKLCPLSFHKERLAACKDAVVGYPGENTAVLQNLRFELMQGERVFLHGENGCGKSTLIKIILAQSGQNMADVPVVQDGEVQVASGLKISYINQDTGHLRGSLKEYSTRHGLDEALFFALLRQLDLERVQFSRMLEHFSEGQKKKVLIAASLMTPAHLYIWDEPLNYIDVFSRMQLEALLLQYRPTMLLVEHDVRFRETVATRVVEL